MASYIALVLTQLEAVCVAYLYDQLAGPKGSISS